MRGQRIDQMTINGAEGIMTAKLNDLIAMRSALCEDAGTPFAY
jgi:hypothetical protein